MRTFLHLLQLRWSIILLFLALLFRCGFSSTSDNEIKNNSLFTSDTIKNTNNAAATSNHKDIDYDDTEDDLIPMYIDTITDLHNNIAKQQQQRNLKIGDFDRFNTLFNNAKIALPDAELGQTGLEINIKNMYCTNINIGDIQTNYTVIKEDNGDVMAYTLTAYPVGLNCFGEYEYKIGFFITGSGKLEAYSSNNFISTRIDLNSPDFNVEPPLIADVEYCDATIRTDGNIGFKGKIVARILNTFKGPISDLIDDRAAEIACDELESIGPKLFGDLLERLKVRIDEWKAPISSELADPLHVENTFIPPTGVQLLSFANKTNNNETDSTGDLFMNFLKQADGLFGADDVDPVTGKTELGFNIFLRESVLDDDGSLTIKIGNSGNGFDPILFDGHDKLTETSILIDGVKIIGLDTLTTFSPFQDIGNYTISNDLVWDNLSVQLNLTIDIKPSTLPDSLLFDVDTSTNIVENITVEIDLSGLDVGFSIFMAINEDKFNAISIGSIMSTDNIFSCFLSSMVGFDIAGLDVKIQDLSVPVLTGFISPGIDRVLNQLAQAAFLAYEPTLLKALPGIFQGTVRKMLKDRIISALLSNSSGCPTMTVKDDFLDFRDLFLEPPQAKELGATGDQPYGNFGHLAYRLIKDKFTEKDSDGMPIINSLLVQPMTKTQSGVEGTLRFPKTLFKLDKLLESRMLAENIMDRLSNGLTLSIGDIRINNLDTIVPPLVFLNMTDSPYTFHNNLNMGNGTGRQLNMTVRVSAGLDDFMNEIDVSVSVDTLALLADLYAMIDADDFMNLSLGDILNYNCWLATIKPTILDENGFAVNTTAERGLSVVDFVPTMTSFAVAADCVSCDSPGTSLLPELITILEETGAIATFGSRLPSLIQLIGNSDTMQTMLDRLIDDAPRFCSSRDEYEEGAIKTKYESLGFPLLDSKSIDTLLYSGVLAAEVAFVVFAETQRQKEIEPSNPLSAQKAFEPPEGIRLIDWENFGNSTGFGSFADKIFEQVREMLSDGEGGIVDFQQIIRDLADDDGSLELDTDFEFENDGMNLSIESVRIEGLDSLIVSDFLKPIGPQTLRSSVQFDTLNLYLALNASVPSSNEPPRVIKLGFGMQNVTADIALFAAFDIDKIGDLEIGNLINLETLFKCFLSTSHAFDIPYMKISVGSLAKPSIEGLEPDTSKSAKSSIEAIFTRFKTQILEAIPAIFDGVGRDMISNVINSFNDRTCEETSRQFARESFVDFRDLILPAKEAAALGGTGSSQYGDLVSKLFGLIRDEFLEVDPETGLAAINRKLIAEIGESQSGFPGRLKFPDDIFNTEKRIRAGGLDAFVKLRVYDGFVDNLDTFGVPLVLLDPVEGEPHLLNNSGVVGVGRPLQAGFRLFFSLAGDDSEIENEVSINLDMSQLQLLLTAALKVSEGALMSFPLKDLSNLQCWLATIPAPTMDERGVRDSTENASLELTKFMASVARLGFNVSCIDCSGPQFTDLTNKLSSLEGTEAVTNLAERAFDFLTTLIEGDFFQVAADRALNRASLMCPHSGTYDPDFAAFKFEPFDISRSAEDPLTFFITLLIVGAVIFVCVIAVTLFTKVVVSRRHRKWLSSLPTQQVELLKEEQLKEDVFEEELNAKTVSMFNSQSIPLWLRLFMPLVILGNIGFFLSGHLSLGASVTILATLAGQSFSENGFFEFSMAKSTIEIWKAGGKELAIIIFIFSFAWPYMKQVVTLFLWFASPNTVSVTRRGSILLWLDALAKWSMIDIFVLIITIVSFRVSIQSPNIAFMPVGFYSVDLLVVPKWGLWANMTAQIISQISSHYIIHYHRRIVHEASNISEEIPPLTKTNTVLTDDDENEQGRDFSSTLSPFSDLGPEESICSYAFRRPHRGESDKLIPRRWVSPSLVVVCVTLCALVVTGCVLPSYSLKPLGLVGVLVESGQAFVDANTQYSVISTIKLLFEQARLTGGAGDYVGLGTLSVLLILSVLVVPVVQAIALMVQWFLPMTERRRNRLSVLLEILQAWQYAEVYLLAIIVGSWQLGPISEFMINPYCESLEGFFSELVYFGILKEEDAQCFRTDVAVEPTFYLLLVAALLLAFANTFVTKAVSQYVHESTNLLPQSRTPRVGDLEDLDAYESEESVESLDIQKIRPVPVLFTDRFRWFLFREDADPSRRTSFAVAQSNSPLSDSHSEAGSGRLGIENCESYDDDLYTIDNAQNSEPSFCAKAGGEELLEMGNFENGDDDMYTFDNNTQKSEPSFYVDVPENSFAASAITFDNDPPTSNRDGTIDRILALNEEEKTEEM